MTNWTEDLPTKEGWYWLKTLDQNNSEFTEIVYVTFERIGKKRVMVANSLPIMPDNTYHCDFLWQGPLAPK